MKTFSQAWLEATGAASRAPVDPSKTVEQRAADLLKSVVDRVTNPTTAAR